MLYTWVRRIPCHWIIIETPTNICTMSCVFYFCDNISDRNTFNEGVKFIGIKKNKETEE